jgi:hypothetical protein
MCCACRCANGSAQAGTGIADRLPEEARQEVIVIDWITRLPFDLWELIRSFIFALAG